MNIPSFKKLLSHKSKVSHKHPYVLKPHRDWRIVTYILVGLILVLIAFSLYLYNGIKHESVFKVIKTADPTTVTVNQVLLDSTLSAFSKKAERESALNTNPLLLSDPSR